ncbi:MAG: hypothetical protein CSB34_04935 [Desulfobulbus propionicus]|nr:MAG: hypothetical protein CSB34_04935 [Desulfobulbus propionicus]
MKRLLIINPYSPYFKYIPMGTFGLCDFLSKRGCFAGIINLALYPSAEGIPKLEMMINDFQPTHVAIIFHWQETAHGMTDLIHYFSTHFTHLPLIIGGFTASVFKSQILDQFPRVNYLVTGDPELPLLHLLSDRPATEIPNLIYQQQGKIIESEQQWLVDQTTLNTISFSTYEALYDYQLYFTTIEDILGVPLFLGRGCVFNCSYCGGSRDAFGHHSARKAPCARSIASILRDLHTLKEATDTLYICYENSQKFITQLFQAIAEDPALRGHFTLNYGAWHLLDDHFLDLYTKAFNTTRKKPIFEFSPEVTADNSRNTIKRHTTYSLDHLINNCKSIERRFQHQVKIELFFSRYHPTEPTFASLLEEIKTLFYLKHYLFITHSPAIHVCYDHLSTDVASRYWSDYADRSFSTFLAKKELIDNNELYPYPVDNLCLYIPESLSLDDQVRIEALIHILEQLEQGCHELFHTLFFCSKAVWIDDLSTILFPLATKQPKTFFSTIRLDNILTYLSSHLAAAEPYNNYAFWPDLIRYSLTKQEMLSRDQDTEPQPFDMDQAYILNKQRVAIHEHEYPYLSHFLNRLDDTPPEKLQYQRTVFLFLRDEVLTLPHRSFRATLQKFEQPLTVKHYLNQLKNTGGIDTDKHRRTIEKLVENDVLQPGTGENLS